MPLDHSKTYRTFKIKNFGHIYRLKIIKKQIKRISKNKKIFSYIDFGCSNGYITNIVKNITSSTEVTGVDHNEKNLETARIEYPEISFRKFNLNSLNPCNNEYDLVTCFETLEHVGDIETALQNLLCSRKKDGIILITVPIEIGFLGYVKYQIKTKLFHYNLSELSIKDKKGYEKALRKNEDISKYRQDLKKDGFGTHFGFDYRIIDIFYSKNNIRYSAWNKFMTRFYLLG